MEDERWLVEALADVFVWETTQLEQKRYVKVMGDYGLACMVKVYLEENGYLVELEPCGSFNQLVIER